jgi:CIC family chloride channel protein
VEAGVQQTESFRESRSAHLIRAGLIGVVAGLVAVLFRRLLTEAEAARSALLAYLHGSSFGAAWGWIVLPCLALVLGCAVGLVVKRLAPESSGSGIPHIKGVLVHLRSLVNWRWLLPVKFVGGIIGIGAGLSMGREGPTVQMGAAIAQGLADIFRVPSKTVPQLVSCGAGAGLAAAFNAPLAGFLFVIEELHRELSARTFAGALVAALSSDIVTRAFSGEDPSFAVSSLPQIPLRALPFAAAIGVCGGLLGVAFNRGLVICLERFGNVKRIPNWMFPGIVASLCGLVAWWLPETVGGGHSTAELLLDGRIQYGMGMLVLLLIFKFMTTVVSYGSGAPGGIFAPMLLIGVLLGTLVAAVFSSIFPMLTHLSTAMGVLGMAAMFTGSIRAPLTGLVLIIELTGGYQQLLALGITCLVADLTANALGDSPIYEVLLELDLRKAPKKEKADAEAVESRTVYIGIQRNSSLEGKAIREAGFPSGCLVVALERSGRELLPTANTTLHPGDHITVLIPSDHTECALDIVRMATGL